MNGIGERSYARITHAGLDRLTRWPLTGRLGSPALRAEASPAIASSASPSARARRCTTSTTSRTSTSRRSSPNMPPGRCPLPLVTTADFGPRTVAAAPPSLASAGSAADASTSTPDRCRSPQVPLDRSADALPRRRPHGVREATGREGGRHPDACLQLGGIPKRDVTPRNDRHECGGSVVSGTLADAPSGWQLCKTRLQ
jgi:hypothetical protein